MRSLLCCTGLLGSGYFGLQPLQAASPTPGTIITNQATGSFVDTVDNIQQPMESNVVNVTVAEVAGITVIANPLGISGTTNPGATVYFSFRITNVGNDPTQFFIPSGVNITSGNATQLGNIEIVSYNLDGNSSVPISITVPNSGGQTGSTGGTNVGLLTNSGTGIFQPGGSVTVRVPVKINPTGVANGDEIVVQLGDTGVDPAATTASPPARLQNQVYAAGSKDVYTADNPDTLETAAGAPMNGIREASAAQSIAAIVILPSISGNVFNDSDLNQIKAATGENYGFGNLTAVLLNGANKVVSTAPVDGLGDYTLSNLAAGTYTVKIIKTPTTALTTGVVIPPALDILPSGWAPTGENNNGVIDSVVDRTQTITVAAANLTNIIATAKAVKS